jgi:branched-chain amino acid transport system permease protein
LDSTLVTQYVLAGLVIGVLYALMAVGITFIHSMMKMVNWSMGEYYMMGSYLQYLLITRLLGPRLWYVGIPLAFAAVFVLGVYIQKLVLRPMFVGESARRDDYATVVTIAMMVLFRNLAVVIGGPYQYSVPDYFRPTMLGPLPISGNRLMAMVGTVLILGLFYLFIKYTWFGTALRGMSQNRVGIQTAGVDVQRLDSVAFGIGVGLAAAAGALLAPVFLIYPEAGATPTMKGFEIIVIGGLGSVPGSIVAAILLGMVESLGSVYMSAAYRDLYGFVLLIGILLLRPTGLFGERERLA